MELRKSTTDFLEALATLCHIYGVTRIHIYDGKIRFALPDTDVMISDFSHDAFHGILEQFWKGDYEVKIDGEVSL